MSVRVSGCMGVRVRWVHEFVMCVLFVAKMENTFSSNDMDYISIFPFRHICIF